MSEIIGSGAVSLEAPIVCNQPIATVEATTTAAEPVGAVLAESVGAGFCGVPVPEPEIVIEVTREGMCGTTAPEIATILEPVAASALDGAAELVVLSTSEAASTSGAATISFVGEGSTVATCTSAPQTFGTETVFAIEAPTEAVLGATISNSTTILDPIAAAATDCTGFCCAIGPELALLSASETAVVTTSASATSLAAFVGSSGSGALSALAAAPFAALVSGGAMAAGICHFICAALPECKTKKRRAKQRPRLQ
jgi:hypothetical protein